ncbi:putative calcium-binding protein CML41 [Gossypium australe]|uniref:Putative calcium-binding protein CML41 n=1 Tax=Gossypium australe TaxID=47621 RepID=A0A5B6W429_9ROSI|nr:putative calcium-binding protein CML41 [Gossypium australe]
MNKVLMGIATISKPTKWFSYKGLSLVFPPFLSKSKSSTSLPLSPPTVPLPPLNKTTKNEELRQVFHRFDHNGDGKISSEELSAYFASIGDNVSSNVVRRVIKDFDNDGDELLGFEDFVKLMEGGDDGDDIKRAFEMYEGDKGCGCITPVGLQQMLGRLGDVRSYEECKAMIGVFDLDGNGVLDFNEFQHMMKGVEPNRNEIVSVK